MYPRQHLPAQEEPLLQMVPALQDSGVWIMSDNTNNEDGYIWVKPASVCSGESGIVLKQFVLKDGETCTLDDIVDAVLSKLEERSKLW